MAPGRGPALALVVAARSILALDVTAGAALLSVAAPLAREFTGAAAAAWFVGALSVCNGAGRVLWGVAPDAAGRPPALLAMFTLQAPAFARLARIAGHARDDAGAGGRRRRVLRRRLRGDAGRRRRRVRAAQRRHGPRRDADGLERGGDRRPRPGRQPPLPDGVG
jgi:hypothetical protein